MFNTAQAPTMKTRRAGLEQKRTLTLKLIRFSLYKYPAEITQMKQSGCFYLLVRDVKTATCA